MITLNSDGIETEDVQTFNVGGGAETSASLRELNWHCEKLTGNPLSVSTVPETRANKIGYYVTDNAKVETRTGWWPKRKLEETMTREIIEALLYRLR